MGVPGITLSRSSVAFIGEYEIMDLYLVGEAASWLNRKRYYLEPWRLEFNDAICTISAMDIHKGVEENESHSLSYLLHGTLECGITFPEDRIYDLLGIARESNHFCMKWTILPDPKKSFQEIYRDATRLILEYASDLNILNNVVEPTQRPQEWSSWVPDWSRGNTPYRSVLYLGEFRACAGKHRDIGDAEDPMTLKLRGFDGDVITHCSLVFSERAPNEVPDLWLHEAQYLGHYTDRYNHSNETLGEAFTMTVLAGLLTTRFIKDECSFFAEASAFWQLYLDIDLLGTQPGLLSSPNAEQPIYSGLSQCQRFPGNVSDNNDFERRLVSATYRRCFFTTHNTYIGLGPPGMQPGDQVVLLYGGKPPYTLRPCLPKCKEKQSPPVGDCDVDHWHI